MCFQIQSLTGSRKIFGYPRYDCEPAQKAINDLYRNELRTLQNLFLPSMKLVEKSRVGSKLIRRYDKPHTPLERLLNCPEVDRIKTEELKRLRNQTCWPNALSKNLSASIGWLTIALALARKRLNPKHHHLSLALKKKLSISYLKSL
jgi:hypothetical protein